MANALNDFATIITQYNAGGCLIFVLGIVTAYLLKLVWRELASLIKTKTNKGS